MRGTCEKLFQRYLKPLDSRPGGLDFRAGGQPRPQVYVQTGRTMVIVETRQWKLSYSPMERAKFDLSDEGGLFIEVTGEENGVHLIPWNMILRITVNEGEKA